jgi:hypothetical protein
MGKSPGRSPRWVSSRRSQRICDANLDVQAAPLGSFRNGERDRSAPVQKTFVAEGEILEHALNKSFRIRNEALKKPMAPR